ncbi:MAG: hypothetical protein HY717_10860 [Planctomycetes bacterium]|nr:hypothetical protein [Planctomycetota bacterium]
MKEIIAWLSAFFFAVGLCFSGEHPFCNLPMDCVPDTEHIFFEVSVERNFRICARKGEEFTAFVVFDIKSAKMQGWSFGVRHDPVKLQLLEATHFAPELPLQPEDLFFPVIGFAAGDPPPGFISAIPLYIFPPPAFPLPGGDNFPIAKARYKVIADLDPSLPTFIEFSDDLNPPNSPPTPTLLTVDGKTKKPEKVTDGEVRGESGQRFRRGDVDGNGRLNIADAIISIYRIILNHKKFFDCDGALDSNGDSRLNLSDPLAIVLWLFQGGQPLPAPFRSCNCDPFKSSLGCTQSNCEDSS